MSDVSRRMGRNKSHLVLGALQNSNFTAKAQTEEPVSSTIVCLFLVQPNNNKEDKIKTKLKFEIKMKRNLKGLSNLQKYERVKDVLKYIENPLQIYLKIMYVSKWFNYELRYVSNSEANIEIQMF